MFLLYVIKVAKKANEKGIEYDIYHFVYKKDKKVFFTNAIDIAYYLIKIHSIKI